MTMSTCLSFAQYTESNTLLISSKVAQHGLWDLNKPLGLVVVGRFFFTDREALLAAANYIQANLTCAGLSTQSWDFITPLPV